MLRPLLLRWAVLSLPLAFSAASAATWHVNPEGTGDAPTIQAAIDSASDGDEVVLADGTYTGEGNRDVAFLGKAITVRSQSNDPDACMIDLDQAGRWGPRRGFLFQKGEGAGSILSSVTIRNAYLGSTEPNKDGGGIYCESASPLVENCVIESCYAAGEGGGCYVSGNSSPRVEKCVFRGNGAESGGAAICGRDGASMEIVGCLFNGNIGASHGGGILVRDASVLVTGSTFRENAGGGLFAHHGFVTVAGCRFEGNTASAGGGVHMDDGAYLVVSGTVFQGNHAEGRGGAILADNLDVCVLDRCTISGNLAGGDGGGLLVGSGTAQITRSILYGSCSENGDGGPDDLYVDGPASAVLLCTAVDPPGIGGSGSVVYKQNVIFDDPLFCDAVDCDDAPATGGDYSLRSDSPCLDHAACGLIGALGEGCIATSVPIEREERASWSGVKRMFR